MGKITLFVHFEYFCVKVVLAIVLYLAGDILFDILLIIWFIHVMYPSEHKIFHWYWHAATI